MVKEIKHAGFEDLVADGQHVIAVRDVERAGARNQCGQFLRAAGNVVIGADRDQRRAVDTGDLLAAERVAPAAHAGGERLEIRLGLLGEAAKGASDRMGHIGERGRFQGRDDDLRQIPDYGRRPG